MAGKELTFKLVMDADVKNFVENTERSEAAARKMFDELKKELQNSTQSTEQASQGIEQVGDKAQEAASKTNALDQALGKTNDELGQTANTANDAGIELKSVGADAQSSVSGVNSLEQGLDQLSTELDDVKTTSNEAGQATSKIVDGSTTTMVTTLTEKLNAANQQIKDAGTGAGETARNFTEFGTKAEKALEVVKNDLDQAKQKLQQFAATNASPADIATAQAEVDKLEKEVEQADQAFKGFANAADTANRELQETETVSQKVNSEVAGLKTGFNAVTGALAALGLGVTAQELAKTADEWNNLNARVKIAVGEHGDVKAAMRDVVQIATETNSNLTATGDLYARLTKIGQEMAIPQDQVLQLTKTINQAIQVSGGSADSAQAAITQLQQALASGVLRGDEFNSMMEQSPRLAQALADGLGVTTGELRSMAGEGKLTTEVVTKALLSQSEAIQKEFSQFPKTIGGSIENLKTSWTVFLGELDQTHGVSAKAAEALTWVAQNLDAIATALEVAGRAFIAYKALNLAATFIEKANSIKVASTAITQETTVVAANTQAQLTNAKATQSAASAKAGLATAANNSSKAVATSTAASGTSLGTLIGRLGAFGIAVTALGVLVPTVLEPLGTAIGEGVAKLMGYGDAIEALERQIENEAARTRVAAEVKAEFAKAAEENRVKTYQLSEASQELVTKYQQLTKEGKSSAEALKEVQESMKFDSLTGINDAVSALNMLERTAKATGAEVKASLKDAMSGEDLVVFQANAKAAFAGTAQEASKNALVMQTAMELALERTGLSTEQLKGQFSKTFQSASNDVQMVINNLDTYKAQGIDTGLALSASLNNAIDTVQTRKELDYAKNKLIEYGNQGLLSSGQVASGLTKIEEKSVSLPASIDVVAASFKALSIDADVSLNKVSTKFEAGSNSVDEFAKGLEGLGATGKQAADLTYQAWKKWLETAKSQAEIDAAKAKLQEFGAQGQISTSQVEQGLIAIKMQAQKLPDDIDPVTESFKRLGIETKENLKLAAQQAMMDFINIRDSGKATAEGVEQAYRKAMQAAEVSGDAGVQASARAQAASVGMVASVDDAGKTTVQTYKEMDQAATKHASTVSNQVTSAYRQMGQVAREEAKHSIEAWNAALSAKSNATSLVGSGGTGTGVKFSYNAEDIAAQLVSLGYDEKKAKQLGKQMYENSKSGTGFKSASNQYLSNQGVDIVAAQRLSAYSNADYIREQLQKMEKYVDAAGTMSSTASKKVQLDFTLGNSSASATTTEQGASAIESMMRELEMLKKGM